MKYIKSNVKKIFAGFLAAGMVVTGIILVPKQADAEASVMLKSTVIYDETYKISDYWNNGKKAPVKDGYVFGGWFKEDSNSTANNKETLTSEDGSVTKTCVPLTAKEIDADENAVVDAEVVAIAKFVPAQVLSVKAQNGVDKNSTLQKIDATTVENITKENPMWVRVMTSQDSENYSAIGFDIRLANKKKPLDSADNDDILETNKVFNKVYVGDTLTAAEDIFGQNSHYVCVWKLDKIDTPSNADKIIYVRPYWYTMDGTKVLGIAKYVHIEDEYLGYISIPVNIFSTDKIAAGTVTMSYDYTGLQPISEDESKYFEAGRILPEMKVNHNATDKTFSMVGNAAEVDSYNDTETIYANIRFKKPITEAKLTFDMTLGEFCNWDEKLIENENVKVWDIAYEIKATTN